MTIIKPVDYSKGDKIINILDKLYQLLGAIKNRQNNPVAMKLSNAITEMEEELSKCDSEIDARLKTWKTLLYKYYKMTKYKNDNGFEYQETVYIYPYRVIDENETVWVLEVKSNNDYHGGVVDRNYTIDCSWDYEIRLEEITKEDFEKAANDSVKHVIQRRLSRIEFEQNEAMG